MAGSPHVMCPVISAVTMQLLNCVNNELGPICWLYFDAERKYILHDDTGSLQMKERHAFQTVL